MLWKALMFMKQVWNHEGMVFIEQASGWQESRWAHNSRLCMKIVTVTKPGRPSSMYTPCCLAHFNVGVIFFEEMPRHHHTRQRVRNSLSEQGCIVVFERVVVIGDWHQNGKHCLPLKRRKHQQYLKWTRRSRQYKELVFQIRHTN